MPFTIEEFHDLVRLLEERPEWRAELRRLVLTDELLTLPELVRELAEAQRRTEERVGALDDRMAALAEAQRRTEEQVAALVEAQRRTEERVTSLEDHIAALVEAQLRTEQQIEALTAAQLLTERRLATLTDDMADVKGIVLELRYHHRAHAYFGPLIRRTRVLSPEEIDTLLEAAVAQGLLSEAEADEIVLADLLLRGRRREDNAEVYIVVEISWKIDLYDVERSVRRATLLSRLGTPAIPVVAGKEVIEEAANLAGMLQVWQLTNGQAIPPQQRDSTSDHPPSHA
jgi:multidrug efflux pump subunit AcrA (membrane-fusion protein)